MKLTKKLEAEIKALMDDYWDSYFRGDLKHWRNYLVDDYRNIGGTEEEVWNSKKEILDYTRRIIDQMIGSAEIRNKKTQIIPYDPYIMVHEFIDLFIKVEGKWNFYGKFRLSSLIQKTAKGWKVLHQHGSYPDSHTEQGEAFAFDNLRKENTQLREAVKRRTVDLENKNRELEIETALEKVRAIALGMKEPADMPEVCKTISLQLQSLGVKEIRNVQTAIFYQDRGTYMNYEYYAKHKKTFITETVYTNHRIAKAFALQMLKGKGETYITHIKNKKVKEWLAYQKTTNVFIDKYLNTAASLNYYWHSLGPVALGISTYSPLSKNELGLFKRFLNVFELAYTRYLDIEQALAQAKEAQIEAALERVRSRSMAMHNASELQEVIHTVHKELLSLQLAIYGGSFIVINRDIDNELRCWGSGGTADTSEEVYIPRFEKPFIKNLINGIKKGHRFFTEEYSQDQKKEFFTFLFKHQPWASLDSNKKKEVLKSPGGYTRSCCVMRYTSIFIINQSGRKFTEAENDILQRFAKVFEQTYTRFLDLQKAEAQAREAKIEAALERVRSRTNAMHRSESLHDVIKEVNDQLQQLGFRFDAADFLTDYSDKGYNIWIANFPTPVYVPAIDHRLFNLLKEVTKRGASFFTFILTTKEKNIHFKNIFENTLAKNAPEELKQYIYNAKGMATSCAVLKNITLSVTNFASIPYTDEENEILKRFAYVFEQSYTRFLDLKKAEAQAREAQIEASLEKVRAQALGMKKPGDLLHIVEVVFSELNKLGFTELRNTMIQIHNDAAKSFVEYDYSISSGPTVDTLPYNIHPVTENLLKQIRSGNDAFAEMVISGKKLKDYREHLVSSGQIDDPLLEGIDSLSYYFYSIGLGSIGISTYSPITEEKRDLLRRFRNVFDFAYRRYVDVAQAETQAREARIELALERTRTQSMIMQHSKELDDTLRVFHEQVLLLDIPSAFSFLWLPDEKNDRHIFWAAWEEGEKGSTVFKSKAINYPLDRNEPATAQCLIDWKSNDPVYSYHVPPAGVKNYFAVWQELIDGVDHLKPEYFSDGLHYVEAFMKYGCFGVMVESDLAEDEKKILNRFAIEFERTYTRFLDLQKAEAQAREAQIEAGLERVRSRAMAMQNSEELNALIGTVFTELIKLDLVLIRCVIFIYEGNENGVRWWMANSEAPSSPMNCFVKYVDLPVFNSYLKGWQERSLKWQYVLEGQEKFMSDEFAFKETELSQLPDFVIAGMRVPERIYLSASFNSFGCLTLASLELLSDEHIDILIRFAKVFDLTYTRFNDLKQAEAQAREAQIELGLERVRARAMAMQKSHELRELIATVSNELRKLDIVLDRCFIIIYDPRSNDSTWWMANPETPLEPVGLLVKYHEDAPYLALLKAWNERILESQYILEGETKKTWDKFLFTETGLSKLPQMVSANMQAKDKVYLSSSYNNFGSLTLATLEPLSNEQFDIMLRFAKVFDLTYTRFNDLQKAEAQAREAQIEAALERVRSRTMAMHKSEELPGAASLLFHQIQILGMPAFAAGYCIWEEEKETITLWMSSEGVLQPPFKAPTTEDELFIQMRKGYEDGRSLHIVEMGGEELVAHYRYMRTLPVVGDIFDSILEAGHPLPVFQVMHYAYFSKGFLLIITYEPVPDAHAIFKRFAAVFEQTYTRFLDLQKAEAQAEQASLDLIQIQLEKKRAEDALTELQVTQKQLIQAEKMASLGELTAGIAHEIQNPLNFVNNFSDVSKELLDEMKTELDKGNMEDAKEIANDVIQNLEKINHHGKRADGIVKGMLQHSRTGSGQKELTDINSLCDEYLRLAYHGLRAKDKSFNAKFETELDNSIGKVNIIPQDIGRVLVNLINNAFYAVSEKLKQNGNVRPDDPVGRGYEPFVIVTSKKNGDRIVLSVKDNGNGIPEKVVDKIFQPFFTTKPTGQGTGLGLSLSYDIVKSHGGELLVETKEGEGTEFIISLPVNQ